MLLVEEQRQQRGADGLTCSNTLVEHTVLCICTNHFQLQASQAQICLLNYLFLRPSLIITEGRTRFCGEEGFNKVNSVPTTFAGALQHTGERSAALLMVMGSL